MTPAALVVVLASNSEGTDPIGDWDGAGNASHDGYFRYDETLGGEVWQAFRLRNEAEDSVTIELFETWTDGGLDWDLDSCGAAIVLAPGEDCEIRSTWNTAETSYQQAEVIVHSDDAERPEISIVVSAEGLEDEGCSTVPGPAWLAWLAIVGLRRKL